MHDGVIFDTAAMTTASIAEETSSPGVRVAIPVRFAGAKNWLQIDVGFGDVVTPAAQEMIFPTLLDDMVAPTILAYSVETVIAEKFEAMIKLSDD